MISLILVRVITMINGNFIKIPIVSGDGEEFLQMVEL